MPRPYVKLPGASFDLDLFRLAAEHAPVHIIFTDPDGVIQYANPAAEQMTGYPREMMIGKRPNLWGGHMPKSFYQEMWATIKKQKHVFRGEIENVRKTGTAYLAEVTISPVIEGTRLKGFVGIERDITNEKKLFDAFLEGDERYRLALRAAREIVWDLDVAADRVVYSEGLTTFGYESISPKPVAWWTDRIHPEDRKRIGLSWRKSLASKDDTWAGEYRFRLADDSFAVVKDFAIIVRDKKGKAMRVVGAFQDITREKQAEIKMREVEFMKNRFIQIVSHQFRTPLNAIRWNLDALADEQIGALTEAQRQFARLIRDMDVEVIDRIGDLLTALDIEEGRVVLDRESVSLVDLTQTVVGDMKQLCKIKSLVCRYAPPTGRFPTIRVDAEKIKIAAQKLLENAVGYTPKNGSIRVSLTKTKSSVRFSVTDTGVGIPSSEQSRVFTRFFRATNASTAKPDASGLGLFIAKSFVEQHGGKIGFTSTEGKGSTFWFELPIKS